MSRGAHHQLHRFPLIFSYYYCYFSCFLLPLLLLSVSFVIDANQEVADRKQAEVIDAITALVPARPTTAGTATTIQYDYSDSQQFKRTVRNAALAVDRSASRRRRAVLQERKKPERMERLQWPGPCDEDNHCPPNLYCIDGDCWHLPNKPLRSMHSLLGQHTHTLADPLVIDSSKEQRGVSKIVEALGHLDSAGKLYRSLGDTHTPSSPLSTTELVMPEISGDLGADAAEAKDAESNEIPDIFLPNADPFDDDDSNTYVQWLTATTLRATVDDSFEQEQLVRGNSSSSERADFHIDKPQRTMSEADPFGDGVSSEEPSRAEEPVVWWGINQPLFMEYTRERRRGMPVRVELHNARALVRDECSMNWECGRRMICCRKRWCDLDADCGSGNFCLPHCGLTKRTSLGMRLAEAPVPTDIIYD